jgi:hypothetical protein
MEVAEPGSMKEESNEHLKKLLARIEVIKFWSVMGMNDEQPKSKESSMGVIEF